jgi:hypothetical protein
MTDSNMSDATRQGSSTTSGLSEAGRETYQQVKSKAMDAVSRTTEAAKSQAMGQAETAKDALADTGERLAESLRGALDGGDESVQARLMAAAADTVSQMSHSLRGRSFNQLLSDAEAFARRNPGAFVAAAALAGFALARFARASAPSQQGGEYGGQSYGAMGGSSMGTGAGMGAGYPTGHHVSTSGMSTHDDDMDEAGSTADEMGGGLGSGSVGSGTPNSTSDTSGTGYDR